MSRFLIEPHGKCSSCSQCVPDSELIHCCSCNYYFHALCTSVDKTDMICNISLLKLFKGSTTKDNFKWFCDSCLTKLEMGKVATMEERFGALVEQVSKMASDLNDMKSVISVGQNQQTGIALFSSNNEPNNGINHKNLAYANRIQQIRSSLVVKQKSSADTASSGA